MNSVKKRAGHEMIRRRADFSAARISPRTAATKNPNRVACIVTTMPFRRIGKIDVAKSQLLLVSQGMPKSTSGVSSPAPDGTFKQLHNGCQYQRHAEIHKQQ